MSTTIKFIRQLISILATQVDAPTIALRLFLLAAQVADECGFEDLTYDLYVQAFTVYEESISESRAQLQAVALIVGTLQGAKVFGSDNFDTLITKAALHGAKLLKKPHQSTAVSLASHMWWQETSPADVEAEKPTPPDGTKEKEEDVSSDNIKAVSRHGSQRLILTLAVISFRIRTANGCSNVYRNRSGSLILPRRR